MADKKKALVAENISKKYESPSGPFYVLNGLSFFADFGDTISVTGPSGSGKTTLLNILGSLDIPDSGSVKLEGTEITKLTGKNLSEYRNKKAGFVFQDHHLLPQCTALENTLLPAIPAGDAGVKLKNAKDILSGIGLKSRMDFYPGSLSGGERQRVAVARALINSPRLLLCDEPTGNLDSKSSEMIVSLFIKIARTEGIIVIMATHNEKLAGRFKTRFKLLNGKLIAR